MRRVVVGAEDGEERHGANGHRAGQCGVHGNEQRVPRHGPERDAERGAQRRGELLEGLDQRLHVGGGLRVRELVHGHHAEDLADRDEEVERRLHPDADLVGPVLGCTAGIIGHPARVAGQGLREARAPAVDQPLRAGRVGHRQRQQGEGRGDAGDGPEGDAAAREEREQEALDQGVDGDVEDGVQGLDRVVGDPGELHLAGLRDEVVRRLVEAQVEYGEADDHAAGPEPAPDLLHESRRPGHFSAVLGPLA